MEKCPHSQSAIRIYKIQWIAGTPNFKTINYTYFTHKMSMNFGEYDLNVD
jgi:hypothetical protein